MDALTGRVAVVTGGASGIGRALAVALDAAGCNVVLADVEKVALDDTVNDMRARGSSAIGVACDVRSKEDMEALARQDPLPVRPCRYRLSQRRVFPLRARCSKPVWKRGVG